METNLNWKRGLFKSVYEIFSGEIPVGILKPDSWSNRGNGELNGKIYSFETKGFFNQETRIINPDSNVQTGKITYNTWKTKAIIEYGNKTYTWKYDNTWNTKWSLSDNEGILVRYNGSYSKGDIGINVPDELLILSGLYISNYFWQITSVVMIVSVYLPIFMITYY